MKIANINRFIKDKKFRFSVLSSRGFYRFMDDESFLMKQYDLIYGKPAKLGYPTDFNEKILWLKLKDRRAEYTEFTDKARLGAYVNRKLGEGYAVPLVGGPWKSFDEIDFDALPERFVLKTTHDSGGVVVCADRAKLDMKRARKRLEKSLKRNYYWGKREWQYKDIEPRIIAEEYLDAEGELYDYKIMCFNGEAKLVFLYSDIIDADGYRAPEECGIMLDRNYEPMPFKETVPPLPHVPEKPENWDEMLRVAEKLAEGIPLLRVDLYNVNGKIYVGELTLHHNAGLDNVFDPPEWADTLGSWIELPGKKTFKLRIEEMSLDHRDFEKFQALYYRNFPEHERNPVEEILGGKNGAYNTLAFYLEDEFVGFISQIEGKRDVSYVTYYSVEERYRSNGLGSAIIAEMMRKYPDRRIISDVECFNLRAKNKAQRKARRKHLMRMGIKPVRAFLRMRKDNFQIFVSGGDFSWKEYKQFWIDLKEDYNL